MEIFKKKDVGLLLINIVKYTEMGKSPDCCMYVNLIHDKMAFLIRIVQKMVLRQLATFGENTNSSPRY